MSEGHVLEVENESTILKSLTVICAGGPPVGAAAYFNARGTASRGGGTHMPTSSPQVLLQPNEAGFRLQPGGLYEAVGGPDAFADGVAQSRVSASAVLGVHVPANSHTGKFARCC